MKTAVVVLVAALAACTTPPSAFRASPGAIQGRIDGVRNPDAAARVQVCSVDADGLVTEAPYESIRVEPDGRFATRVLSPGRYRLIYRDPAAPPSVVTVRVPFDAPVVLRSTVEPRLVELRAIAAGTQPLHCRLTSEARVEGVADVREFQCGPDARTVIRGLRPGRWRLDVLDLAATTEIDLPSGGSMNDLGAGGTEIRFPAALSARELTVDPPPIGEGSNITGQVRRLDGLGARSMLVTARPFDADRGVGERWGRFAETDAEGGFRLVGIPPGEAYVQVECREVLARILPAPRIVTIPPSGTVELGFLVEP